MPSQAIRASFSAVVSATQLPEIRLLAPLQMIRRSNPRGDWVQRFMAALTSATSAPKVGHPVAQRPTHSGILARQGRSSGSSLLNPLRWRSLGHGMRILGNGNSTDAATSLANCWTLACVGLLNACWAACALAGALIGVNMFGSRIGSLALGIFDISPRHGAHRLAAPHR